MADNSRVYLGLNLVQINIRSSSVATAQLVHYAIRTKLDVLLVKDPYVVDFKVMCFPVSWFVAAHLSASCAIIEIDKRLQAVMADRFLNSVSVNITCQDSVLTVGSQYSAPSAVLSDDLNS